jgi:hypothetical protein
MITFSEWTGPGWPGENVGHVDSAGMGVSCNIYANGEWIGYVDHSFGSDFSVTLGYSSSEEQQYHGLNCRKRHTALKAAKKLAEMYAATLRLRDRPQSR